MSKAVFFGQNDLRFFYYRYKDSGYYNLSIIVFTIIMCVILILYVIVPQVEKNFSIRREVAVKRMKIKKMEENINFMNNLNKSLLNSQLQTVFQALPAEKSFIDIINAISDSAIHSGVTLDDFNVNVGKDEVESKSFINLSIVINGDINNVKRFLQETSRKLPLSEVEDLAITPDSSTVTMKFNYKSYPEIKLTEDKSIESLTDSQVALIREISSWKPFVFDQSTSQPTGSDSAVPLF